MVGRAQARGRRALRSAANQRHLGIRLNCICSLARADLRASPSESRGAVREATRRRIECRTQGTINEVRSGRSEASAGKAEMMRSTRQRERCARRVAVGTRYCQGQTRRKTVTQSLRSSGFTPKDSGAAKSESMLRLNEQTLAMPVEASMALVRMPRSRYSRHALGNPRSRAATVARADDKGRDNDTVFNGCKHFRF